MVDRLIGELTSALPDVPSASTTSLVTTAATLQKFESAVSARKHGVVAELFARYQHSDNAEIDPWDALEAELGPALTLSPTATSALINLGHALGTRLPNVFTAFTRGDLDHARARTIADATANVADEHIKEVETRVLKAALDGRAPLVGRRLTDAINRVIHKIDRDGVRRRRERKQAERSVWVGTAVDGVAEFGGTLKPEDAAFLNGRLSEMAARVCSDDPRTFQARRADSLMALVRGQAELSCACGKPECAFRVDLIGSPRRPLVHVITTADTLAGTSDEPGFIDGLGVIDAADVHEIARDAIVRELKNPVIESRYRPSQDLQDWVRAKFGYCQHPGCDRPAWQSDLDHRDPHAVSGDTSERNLGPLCRKHHRVKTFGGWKFTNASDGVTLTSPLGFDYPVAPAGFLTHLDDDTPPPTKHRTRQQQHADRIEQEREQNRAEREQHWGPDADPPPF